MVGSSKILTVSYGTFSCTLEGFDDSFNTMKAIAEYFRDLAADDRYFGAEPPTPDAEMLARIAEREISRRVEARMDDGGIVLRAAALADQSKPGEPHDADTPADTKAVAAKERKDTAQTKKDDAAEKTSRQTERAGRRAAKAAKRAEREAELKAKTEADEKAAEQDAQDAQRKAEVAAQNAALKAEEDAKRAAAAAAKAKTKADAKRLAQAKAGAEAEAKSKAEAEAKAVAAVQADATAAEDAPAKIVNTQADTTPETATAALVEAQNPDPKNAPFDTRTTPAHDDDSIAAKLQRIRAVVDTSANPAGTEFLDTDSPVAELEAHIAEIEQSPATVQSDPVPDGGADMIARVMARQKATPDVTGNAEAPTRDVETAQEPATPEQAKPRVVRMKRADFEKAIAQNKGTSDQDPATLSRPEATAPQTTKPDFAMLDGADDLDDYLEDSDFADIDLEAEITTDTIVDTTERAAQVPDDVDMTAELPQDAAPQAAPARLPQDPDVDDAALDRLMVETDAQMKEPEGSRRRDAIAQLKAAVAAKEAARKIGETEEDDQDVENAFRNDLSDVVHPEGTARPRPVVRSGTRTERPRAAPLKLVAAQRVDMPKTEPRDGPVVPRRVASRTEEAQPQSGRSFAEFAQNMGASELPDLLEAAAAYTSFVEGADEFSRPQILRRVRAVASDDFNREDGLRSFADLLRAGRFTKVRNGRFQVADDSRFNPESRAS